MEKRCISLEERLTGLEQCHSKLVDALMKQVYVPDRADCSYLKQDLVNRIGRYFRARDVHLREQDGEGNVFRRVYPQINKEPLKRVEYGIMNSERIPEKIFYNLTEWEALYFLVGVWIKKSTKNNDLKYRKGLLDRQPVSLIVAETIYAGINYLRQIHQQTKRYKNSIELPYADEQFRTYFELRSEYIAKRKKLFDDFQILVDKEKELSQFIVLAGNNSRFSNAIAEKSASLEEINERISIMMANMKGEDYDRAVNITGKPLSADLYFGPELEKTQVAILSSEQAGSVGIDLDAMHKALEHQPEKPINQFQRIFDFDAVDKLS